MVGSTSCNVPIFPFLVKQYIVNNMMEIEKLRTASKANNLYGFHDYILVYVFVNVYSLSSSLNAKWDLRMVIDCRNFPSLPLLRITICGKNSALCIAK